MNIKKRLRRQAESSLRKFENDSLLRQEQSNLNGSRKVAFRTAVLSAPTFCILAIAVIVVAFSAVMFDPFVIDRAFYFSGTDDLQTAEFQDFEAFSSEVEDISINDMGFSAVVRVKSINDENQYYYILLYNGDFTIENGENDNASTFFVMMSVYVYPVAGIYNENSILEKADKFVDVAGLQVKYCDETDMNASGYYRIKKEAYIKSGDIAIYIDYKCDADNIDEGLFFDILEKMFA